MATHRQKIGAAVVLLAAALVGGAGYWVWTLESPPNVLLITLDTTRADRIGAYGYERARTPVLDRFARDGVLFEHAVSPAPLTLPVHASLFTGLYPTEHGLRTNGTGSLPKTMTTLGEILSAEGYDTAAFVASFVLDSKFGLARGFQKYDDDLSGAAPTQDTIHRFRDGALVVDAALEWLSNDRSAPFFCWVHLYDPHAPYDPRVDEFGDDFLDSPYDGEIAYTDRQVGRLLEFLKQHPETIVIIVGDHGESLGDHFELQHGYTLYSATQHVPLMFRGVPETSPGTRVGGMASLVDMLPTITEMLGLSSPENISGESFLASLRGGDAPARDVYGATDDPYLQSGWSPLRSLTADGWRYIRTSKPELYDLATDPQELHNLAAENPQKLEAMENQLADLESTLLLGEADAVQLSDAEQRALASLGYAAGSDDVIDVTENNLPDVKDMLPFNMRTQAAIDLMEDGNVDEAVSQLRDIVAASPPEHVSSRLYLASALQRQEKYDEAESIYNAVLARRPDDESALFQLGAMYAERGDFPKAIEMFQKSLDIEPEATEPLFNLGLAYDRMGDREQAIKRFERVIQLDAAFPGVWSALGNLRARSGQTAEAITAYEYELRLNPASVEAHVNLAAQLAGQQKLEAAVTHLEQALELEPQHPQALFNLGAAFEMQGNITAAVEQFERLLTLYPDHAPAKARLERLQSQSPR